MNIHRHPTKISLATVLLMGRFFPSPPKKSRRQRLGQMAPMWALTSHGMTQPILPGTVHHFLKQMASPQTTALEAHSMQSRGRATLYLITV